ncbi:hypothetical protein TWF506_003894 [Arthrobotrys conoides]|uniref:CCZ1/INTU/HSP4 first Longin domain-containing protein n=1 Tax=Arthrobotrys conoides TaxID=74498 RepID=A0AAN8RPH7_9PEZI
MASSETRSTETRSSAEPPALSYLAIFNPSLGLTDETLPDQIVFWTSHSPASQNECLRQIGLAQGIIEFARGFSGAQDLNVVETQKSRIVLHEIEAGWWILASIDLTKVHYDTDPPSMEHSTQYVAPHSVLISQLKTSYRQFLLFNGTLDFILSNHGRDILVQRLEKFYGRWAWRWEVLLHGNPAVDVWNGIKIGRGVGEEEKKVLSGFADQNRAEADGSERMIDLVVSRFGKLPGDEKDVKGAKDSKDAKDAKKPKLGFSTRGTGRIPGPDDGCIFRGVGNLTKESVRDLAEWMARWYQYGDSSFDYQTVRPSRKKVRRGKSKATPDPPEAEPSTPGITTTVTAAEAPKEPTVVTTAETPEESTSATAAKTPEESTSAAAAKTPKESTSATAAKTPEESNPATAAEASEESTSAAASEEPTLATADAVAPVEGASEPETRLPPPLFPTGTRQNAQRGGPTPGSSLEGRKAQDRDKKKGKAPDAAGGSNNGQSSKGSNSLMLNVLTLGTYAAYNAWNRNKEEDLSKADTEQNAEPNPMEASGRFIIGYTGALDEDEEDSVTDDINVDQKDFISTTIWVARTKDIASNKDDTNGQPIFEECRLVAYAAYPFIFAMLFRSTNESLTKPTFYKLLHQQLGPLKVPLISSSEKQYQPSNHKGVYDLIFDPATLTVHTSLPSIIGSPFDASPDVTVSGRLPRAEAFHIHTQILRVIEDTRWKDIPLGAPSGERERTNRTNRGWWIAWMRLEGVEPQNRSQLTSTASPATTIDSQVEQQGLVPPSDEITSFIGSVSKHRRGRREAFIIRKGSDHRTHVRASKDSKSGFSIPIKLSGGLGIDTRHYFDQLLNLTART